MRKLGSFAPIVLTGLSVMYGQAVKDPVRPNPVRVSSRAQLIASLERSSVRIGDPIKLHYRLKNVSSEAVTDSITDWSVIYWLIVTDFSGMELPRTKEGDRRRQMPISTGPNVLGFLEPGANDGDHVTDLTELYQLDRPGSYFVRIAQRLGLPPGEPRPRTAQEGAKLPLEEAVSDLIPFTMTP